MINKLTIIIPAYNEEFTIVTVLGKITETGLTGNIKKEIIVVNDCSTDQTLKQVETFRDQHPEVALTILNQPKNMGKGAAIHAAIEQATGEFLVIQDADLEYDPREYNDLLKPAIEGFADVVYGSRFMGGSPHRILFFWHSIGNRFLTFLSNMLTGLNLTDMESGYKLIRTDIIKKIHLREKRFGFEPEVTAKLSRVPGIRIYEIGVSYYGRTFAEGKKINWKDGLKAMYCIFRYNIFR
jgi:glycosyltransferase involved in cell wall biosynthesis